jgi:glycosyltransferase involved in cell wall biosynthesis
MSQKKLLMIAYHFPPIGGAGALRPLKTAKYLPAQGWDPVVLTVENPDWYYARDDRLLKEIQSTTRIVRTFMLRSAWLYRILNPLRIRKVDILLRRYLVHPDDQIGWFPFAVHAATRLMQQENFDAVYSTSAPLTAHLIAWRICQKFGIPWIADFRDEWFENPDLPLPTAFHRRLHYRLEGSIVKTAQQVVAAAPVFCRYLAKHCPDDPKFETITMGFDPDDYNALSSPYSKRNDLFILSFSGLFYGSFRPDNLLKAVHTLIDAGQVERQKICLRFIGANGPHDLREPDKYGICEFTGFLPHDQALHLAGQADALLLLLSRKRGRDVIPSKTFEYMALKKPVLALVPADGDVAGIVRETGIGVVADFDNIRDIASAFLHIYQQWMSRALSISSDASKIEAYSYENLTRRFASLLDRITERPMGVHV